MLHVAATATQTGILDTVLQEFLQRLQVDFYQIENFAEGLFWYLAGIQIVISAIWLVFKNDVMEAVVKCIQLFFVIGVFYTLVKYGGVWMPQLVNAFVNIGASSSGIHSLTPSSVMSQGLSIGFSLLSNFGNWGWLTHPFGCLITCAILIIIVILYALLAAEIAIILVKSYVLITVSGLMFAFGANELVRPISMNYFKALIGIGLQLMVFYLIMGVGVQVGHDWSGMIAVAAKNHAIEPFLVVLAAVIIFYLVVKNVPPFVAGLSGVGGFRSYGDAAVGSAITAGTIGASAMQKAAFVGKGGVQSFGQLGKAAGNTWQSGSATYKGGGKLHHAIGKSALDVTSSLGAAMKDSVMKNNQHMSFGQKFNARMSERAANRSAESLKTTVPSSGFASNQVNK